MRGDLLGLPSIALLAPTLALADMVKCKKPDGGLYVGPTPPENCVPVGNLQSQGSSGSSWSPGAFLPTPTPAPDAATVSKAEAEAAKQKDIERRRGITAVAIQNMVIQRYRNGNFFEGTVANGADFPVYSVQICIDQGQRCQPVAPSTLFPGAQGTFSFEVVGWNTPDYRITWDVVPSEQ
jgi:hypothetical protein